MRLLLVEDDPLIRMSVVIGLEDLGFDVVEAASAEHALTLVEAARPHVIVTDVDLGPGLSGLDLADRVRADRPDLPIVFVTGAMRALDGRRLDAHEAFLAKPYDVAQLAAAAGRLGEAEDGPATRRGD